MSDRDLESIRTRWASVIRPDAVLGISIPAGCSDDPVLELWIGDWSDDNHDDDSRDMHNLDDDHSKTLLDNALADVAYLLALLDRHGITDHT